MSQYCCNYTQDPRGVDLRGVEIVPAWEVLCRSLRHLGERHIAEQQILVTQFFQNTQQFICDPDKICDVPLDGIARIPLTTAASPMNGKPSEFVRTPCGFSSEPVDSFNETSALREATFQSCNADTTVNQASMVEIEKRADKNDSQGKPSFLSKDAMKHINLDQDRNFVLEALRALKNKFPLTGCLLSCADWFMNVEEPLRPGFLSRFVHGYFFTSLTLTIIILNSLFTIYATNRTIALNTETKSPAMEAIDLFFLAFYCLELTLKLVVHRLYFFVNAEYRWNIFDFLLVSFAIMDHVLMSTMDMQNLDLTFMRTLRLMKLSKVLRMFRAMRFFAELRLMLDCVAGSVLSLFWCFVTLGFFKVIFALIFVQSVSQLLLSNKNSNGTELDPIVREGLMSRWGSVQDATFTLFKSTSGGNDWEAYYDLVNLAGPIPSTLFIFYIVFEVFAAVNIVTSMFVDKAMKLAQPDMETLLIEKRRTDMKNASAIMEVCREADSDRSGKISYEEFEKLMNDTRIRNLFELKGLDIKDAQLFFSMLAGVDGDREVDIDTFVAGCMKIKGVAMSVDLLSVSFELKMLTQRETKFMKFLTDRLDGVIELVKSVAPGGATSVDRRLGASFRASSSEL